MHAFLSSIASFIFSPLHWIILLGITGMLIRKPLLKKIFFGTALLTFFIMGNGWLLHSYARNFQPSPVALSPDKVYSCGIIAGGFASPDIDGNGVFNSTSDRFIQALRLFKTGNITHILINGGNGKKELKTFREAEWVKNELIIQGVPGAAIIVEDESNNTADNARNAKTIFDSLKLIPPYLLISSAHHLPRATLLYNKAGVQVVPYPCNYIAGRGIASMTDIIPSLNTLNTWSIYLKETAGYYWYK